METVWEAVVLEGREFTDQALHVPEVWRLIPIGGAEAVLDPDCQLVLSPPFPPDPDGTA